MLTPAVDDGDGASVDAAGRFISVTTVGVDRIIALVTWLFGCICKTDVLVLVFRVFFYLHF